MPSENTVGSLLLWARRELARSKIESPHLASELLIGHVLGWERSRVLAYPEFQLDEKNRTTLESLVSRHCAGEPLQYVLGKQEFYGLVFEVIPAVLIPRPETELLVEKALALAAESSRERLRFADIGTGSGCIAIAVAHELQMAQIYAVDISFEALEVAHRNAVRHDVADRIRFVCSDMLESLDVECRFHFILSNPPYVAASEMSLLPRMVREHEPITALYGGTQGLDPYYRLAVQARIHLISGGYLLMEIGAGQFESVAQIVRDSGLKLVTVLDDWNRIPRCLVAQKNQERTDG